MATPTLVQYSKFGGAANLTTLRQWPLPNVVLSGNAVIVFLQCSNAQTPTVSDDKSGTYTVIQNTDDTGHGQRALCAYRLNVTDGPQVVKATFTGGGNGYLSGYVSEWQNIPTASATDGSNSGTTTGTTITPGSITTGTDGDLILTYIAEDSVDPFATDQACASFTAPSNFTLLAADLWVGEAVAYRIQPTAGAINPSWTCGTSRTYICLQVAFKNASQGTAATVSPRVVGVFHQGIDYQAPNHSTPYTVQIPFQGIGTFFYIAFVGIPDPGNVTDSNSNSWTATGASVSNGASGFVRCYYALNPTITDSMTISIAYSGAEGNPPGGTVFFYECVGLTDTGTVHATGTLTGAGTSFQIGAITPGASNGLVFSTAGQETSTSIAVNIGTFISSTDPNEETSPWANDENNAWSVYNNPNTSAVQPTYTTIAAAGNVRWMQDAFGPLVLAGTRKSSMFMFFPPNP